MNVREALYAAADHIVREPQDWKFLSVRVPGECGTPGCAIGWIAYFSGHRARTLVGDVCEPVLGVSEPAFYARMHEFSREIDPWVVWNAEDASPVHVARCLRLYADKYHPAEKRDAIPASVRAIFETEQTGVAA